jgi:ABC-type transport system involved in Fe-S cluster assembly fused permease/ATPase subunit
MNVIGVVNFQKEEWISLATLNFLNMFQCIVINIGLLGGSLYSGYLVSTGEETVGDYVLFGTYILQLMVPLNWLGSLYRFDLKYKK